MSVKLLAVLALMVLFTMLQGCASQPEKEIRALTKVGCEIGRYYRNSERGELQIECEAHEAKQ